MSSGAAVLLVKQQIVVLEDDEAFARDICSQLESTGRVEAIAAKTLKDFVGIVRTTELDAASVDWRLHHIDQGGEALDRLGQYQPSAGRLVYTFYPQYVSNATGRTDYFVQKQQPQGPVGYIEKAVAAIRLGLARRTLACLQRAGELLSLGPLTPESLESATERTLYDSARERLLRGILAGNIDGVLKRVTSRAGYWRSFDKAAYIKLPWSKKVSEACGFADFTPDDLARILGKCASGRLAETLVSGRAENEEPSAELQNRLRSLMIVLSHILQISNYEPELVPYYWTIQQVHEGAAGPPPWDRDGLAKFLTAGNPNNLDEAVYWIRGH
jgi:CheY-like chemotaxis protein